MQKHKKACTVIPMKQAYYMKQKALNLWAVILILWSFYRAFFKTDVPLWIDEVIIKPIIFILPVVWFISKVEKQSIGKSLKIKPIKLHYYVLFAIVFFGLWMIIDVKQNILFFLGISFITACSEELLSRGFILEKLYVHSKNIFLSAIQSTLLSICLHIPILMTNVLLTGKILLVVIALDFMLGMVVSLLYLEERNILPPILVHTLYSLALYIFV